VKIFEPHRALKIGDLVQDVFTKEVGIVIDKYFLNDKEKPVYRVYLQNPEIEEYPIVSYTDDSLWMISCISESED
jgi:hypothetical protein